jgi:hypothetical protein
MGAKRYSYFMLRWTDRKDERNVVAGFLATYGWVSFACFFYLVITWAAGAPHTPDPSLGLIYPHNEHGSITYFSAFQGTSCALLLGTSPLIFVLGMAASPKKEVVIKTGKFRFAMIWKPDDPRRLRRVGAVFGALAAPLVIFNFGPSLVLSLNSVGIVTGF